MARSSKAMRRGHKAMSYGHMKKEEARLHEETEALVTQTYWQDEVDGTHQIILACDVTDETHEKKQGEPMARATLETREQAARERPLDDDTGEPRGSPATLDNGYDSEAAVGGLEKLGFDPSIAAGRIRHHEAPQVDL